MEGTGFWARAHVLAVFRGCSMLPAGREDPPPHTGISDVDTSQASASCSCPGAWCVLLERLLGLRLSFIDPKSGIPFRLSGWG